LRPPPAPPPHEQQRTSLLQLRRERAELLERAADPSVLLVRADERAPPSRIPEHLHVKIELQEQPPEIDEYGQRFVWTPASSGGGGGGGGCGGGQLTIFPMNQPYGALDIELLEHWLREVSAAGDASSGERPARLDALALALHEVGRASGPARCALLGRLWERAATEWRFECTEAVSAEVAEQERLRARLEQLSQQLDEAQMQLSDATARARVERAALAEARKQAAASAVRCEEAVSHARAAAMAGRRKLARADGRLKEAAAHLTALAARVPLPLATSALNDAAEFLLASDMGDNDDSNDSAGAGERAGWPRGVTAAQSTACDTGLLQPPPHQPPPPPPSQQQQQLASRSSRPPQEELVRQAQPLSAAGTAPVLVPTPMVPPDSAELASMHAEYERASDSLHELVEEAAEGVRGIRHRCGEAVRSALSTLETKHSHDEAVLRKSNQLLAAMRMAGPPTRRVHTGTQTEAAGASLAGSLLELLDAHAARRGGWNGGSNGRHAAAVRLHELVLAAGLGGGTAYSTPKDAASQASLDDEPNESLAHTQRALRGRSWADPLPLCWVPLVANLAPLPRGVLSFRKVRALIWSIYVDRLSSEPGVSLPEGGVPSSAATAVPPQQQQQGGGSGRATGLHAGGGLPAEPGGAVDVLAEGEVVVPPRLPPRSHFAEFVVDWLHHFYGNRALAAAQLTALVGSLRVHGTQDARLSTFARLCGASVEPELNNDALTFLLRVLHLCLTLRPGSCAHFPLEATYLLSLERVHAVTHALFGVEALGADGRPDIELKIRDLVSLACSSKGGGASMDLDEYLLMVLTEHEQMGSRPLRVRTSLLALFDGACRGGVLTLDEWQALATDQGIARDTVQPLYRQMMLATGEMAAATASATKPTASASAAAVAAPASTSVARPLGASAAAFVEICSGAGLDLRVLPPSADMVAEVELTSIEKQWLAREAHFASTLGKLRRHVSHTGGHGPVEYPSAALLARSVALIAELATEVGALRRGERDDRAASCAATILETLQALDATLRRGSVSIELENSAQHMDA
jgi:hypothetical protein